MSSKHFERDSVAQDLAALRALAYRVVKTVSPLPPRRSSTPTEEAIRRGVASEFEPSVTVTTVFFMLATSHVCALTIGSLFILDRDRVGHAPGRILPR